MTPRSQRRVRRHHRAASVVLGIGLMVVALTGLTAGPAAAGTDCSPGGDVCTIEPETIQTPVGPAAVTVTPSDVVTVHLDPYATNTLILGTAFTLPADILMPFCPGECTRTSIPTPGGLISIDTLVFPPGPPTSPAPPNLAIVSIHPPSPCRSHTTGTTVVFTPISLP